MCQKTVRIEAKVPGRLGLLLLEFICDLQFVIY